LQTAPSKARDEIAEILRGFGRESIGLEIQRAKRRDLSSKKTLGNLAARFSQYWKRGLIGAENWSTEKLEIWP
jgi:hypothetical protein